MEPKDWRRFRNPEPPSDDFDFEITVVKNRLKNSLGEPCQYVLTEDVFNYSTGCSEFSESSDDDSIISLTSKNDQAIPLSEKEIKKEKLSSISDKETRPTDLNLSDKEDSRKERKRHKKTKRQSPKNWSGVGYSDSDDSPDEQKYRSKIKSENKLIKQENRPVKQESNYIEDVEKAFGEYKCNVCNLVLNSEVTYQTHIRGKKHIKALNAESITNIAKMSLEAKPNEGSYFQARRPDSIPPRKKFVRVNRVSYIQELVDNYNKGPLPGLSHVDELRLPDKKDTSYYCNLCSAPCSTQSIMLHLTGHKHQLRCLEMIDKKRYDSYSYQPKKVVERKLLDILMDYEREHQKELITVKEEVEGPVVPRHDAYEPYNQPGPSWRNKPHLPDSEPSTDAWDPAMNDPNISCKEDLDMSRNDYYCKTCHSHMNNLNMWESHVRGKRHLKNKKKCPGESASKLKSIPCPDETAHLYQLIEDVVEPIVGLEFISETQNEVGYMYQCHLCGACNTDNDIIDHLLTTKHRTKYLEKLHNNGKTNSIVSINQLNLSNKDSLIEEECDEVLKKYPPQRGVQNKKFITLWISSLLVL